MLVILALRAPVSPVQHGRVPRKGRLGAAGSPSRCRCSSLRAPVSPVPRSCPPGRPPRYWFRHHDTVGSTATCCCCLRCVRGYDARIWRICDAAAALLFAADGVVVMLLLRCCLLLMLWWLMLLLLLRPRGRTGARPMRASSPSVGANSIISSRRNVLLGCTECAVRALSEKVRGGCVHSL